MADLDQSNLHPYIQKDLTSVALTRGLDYTHYDMVYEG